MKASLLLFVVMGAASAHLFRQQINPQQDLVFESLDNFDYLNMFRNLDSQEHVNEYSLRKSMEKTVPFFTKYIQRETPKYGDAIWKKLNFAAGSRSKNNDRKTARFFDDAFKTIQYINDDKKANFHQALQNSAQHEPEDAHLNATQLLKKRHYSVEEHAVRTDDGYLLTMFRVLPQGNTETSPPVVFLLHGLFGSADDWLLMNNSLAYMLSDAGYEVWLGNVRGSKYSQLHVSKHPAQSDFWQFSIDEIANHDLPAMIDHVLQTSGQQKLFFVGHSQGNTALFVLASTRPEYHNKIAMMYALAPMVYMANTRSPFIRMMSPNSTSFDTLQQQLGDGELRWTKELVQTIGGDMCQKQIGCEHICGNVNFVVTGIDPSNMDADLVPVIINHVPSGASARQIKQYGQAMAASELRKYDYGAATNSRVYGNSLPPKYDMTEVKVPVALYYSDDDWMAHPSDVEKLHQQLPDVRDFYRVPLDHFSHMDFQFSRRAPEVINQRVVDSIKNTK